MEVAALVKIDDGYSICSKYQIRLLDPANVIFVIAGPDAQVIQCALQKILSAAQDVDLGVLKQTQHSLNSYYVYGYSEPGSHKAWGSLFYISKGKGNRLFEHLNKRVASRLNSRNAPATRVKDQKIDRWLDLNVDISTTARSLRQRATESLVTCLYSDLTELEAFFIEKFLIMRARRPQDISNDTAGNHNFDEYTSICQPRELDLANQVHSFLWRQAVIGFLDDPQSPRMLNTLRPSLTFIGLELELDALNKALATIGLKPCDMSRAPENRLIAETMVKQFCGVHGAGDAKASFVLADEQRPYRFDFRLPPGGLELQITLRPLECSTNANRAFREFFNNVSLTRYSSGTCRSVAGRLRDLYPNSYIKNVNQWPFYKPFTWDANAIQNDPAFFPMTNPNAPVHIKTNWLEGHEGVLSMLEAIRLISNSFK
jgi:hypothetical protein